MGKNIEIGQYWTIENGSVVLVTKKFHCGNDNDLFIANKVGKHGVLNDVKIHSDDFQTEISAERAKFIAMDLMEKKIKNLLKLK